ncbi:transmembrane channel-like protein 3 isoform X2 [Anopheles stephensi]|uniref:transmembrane channel-like protein 3 isoform X2 n=1 Tax=Anopheles stephensi TaxID=30069 RepID=UPI00165890BC|nr:transmembrane channel-like protein 3 isoform X2 [Anopheles stephensi]
MARHRAVLSEATFRVDVNEIGNGRQQLGSNGMDGAAGGGPKAYPPEEEDKIEVLQDVHGQEEQLSHEVGLFAPVGGNPLASQEDQFQGVNSFRRWSSNFGRSVKNNKRTVYNKTIRLMPSRIQKTLSIDGDLITTSASDVDHITMELGQREQLMEDNPIAEQLRIETIKSIAHKISTKRQIREQLSQTVNRRATRSKSIGLIRRYRYSGKLYATRAAKLLKSFVTNFELFYGSMKQIEGHFGSRISAYFKFLRQLLVLNLVLLLFIGSFVIFPQLLAGHEPAGSVRDVNARQDFHLRDLFTGEGYLSESVMYYGSYSNRSFTLVPGTAEYSLPHAYFLTITILSLATFVIVSISMGRSYRISFIESSATVQNILTHKIVCSWDYGIANEKAARLKHATILNELRDYLAQRNRPPFVAGRWHRLRREAVRLVVHVTVLTMISAVAASLWALLARFGETDHFTAWSALYVSVVSNVTMVAFGYACQLLGQLEQYRQVATRLNINLLRHFLLQLTIVGVLLAYWLTRTHTAAGCWETLIGQELYRLLVVDFFISTVLLCAVRGIRYLLHARYGPVRKGTRSPTPATCLLARYLTPPPFCIETHSLGLVYNQTLLWFGVLFAPLLVLLVALKLLLVFYINKFELIYLCQPPARLWRSSQTQTLFLVLVFVSLFGVLLTHGYIIMQVPVSTGCGPFRGTEYMYQLFMQGILKLREEHLFWRVFVYITKPAIIGGVLLTMGVVTYYLRAKSRAQVAKVKLLKELLRMEAKDKEFLLANLSKVTRGKDSTEQLELDRIELVGGGRVNGPADKYYTDPCATWRYEETPRKSDDGTGNSAAANESTGSCSGYQRFEDEEQLRMRRT